MGSLPEQPPTVRALIIGGSYGGLGATVNLLDLCDGLTPRFSRQPHKHHPDLPLVSIEITIVDERDGYYHLIGSPLAFASSTYAEKTWVTFKNIVGLQRPNVRFVQGSVASVDCDAKTATIRDHTTNGERVEPYDYLVVASGLRRAWPVVPLSLTRKAFLLEAEDQIHAVSNAPHGVIIVGGGAVGIEMAAELKLEQPQTKVVLVHSRDQLLSAENLADECKELALTLLREAGVEVFLNHRLTSTQPLDSPDGVRKLEVTFTNGAKMLASEVVMAISRSQPSTTYLPPSALDPDGYVKVQSSLQLSPGTPNHSVHFAVGDLALWSGIKRCGGAMHMGYAAALNIHQLIVASRVPGYETDLMEVEQWPPMIALAVGKKAVASDPEKTVAGEDVMKLYFRDDLGFAICWDYMQLSGRKLEEAVV